MSVPPATSLTRIAVLALVASLAGCANAALPAPASAPALEPSQPSEADVQRWMAGFAHLRPADINRQSVAAILGVPPSRFHATPKEPDDPPDSDGGDALGPPQGWPFELVLPWVDARRSGQDMHFRFDAINPRRDTYRPPVCVDAAWLREEILSSGWALVRKSRGFTEQTRNLRTWIEFRRMPPGADGALFIEYNARSDGDDGHGCVYEFVIHKTSAPGD